MQGQNRIEKFKNTRKKAREEMYHEGRGDGRKRHKTKRGSDHWEKLENDQYE